MQADRNPQPILDQSLPLSDSPPIAAPSQVSFNQAQLQAQAIQAQREQIARSKIQQAFNNKLAVSSTASQAIALLSASALMLSIAKYVFLQ